MTYTMIFRRLSLLLMSLAIGLAACTPTTEPAAEPVDTPAVEPTEPVTYPEPDDEVVSDPYPEPIQDQDDVITPYPEPQPDQPNDDLGLGSIMDNAGTVEMVEVLLLESFPLQAMASVNGYFSNGCWSLEEVTIVQEDETRFVVNVRGRHSGSEICTEALVPFTETVEIPINGLSAGTYIVEANGQTAMFELKVDNILELPNEKPNIQIGQADVTDLAINLDEAAGMATVSVLGYLRDGCTNLGEILIGEVVDNTLQVQITTTRDADAMCTMAIVDFQESFELSLAGLDLETLRLDVNGFIVDVK